MISSLKNARISPKKMNLVAELVRGQKAVDALNQLKFTPKKAAHILYKVISSAVANATNNRAQDADKLYIKSILVTKGTTYKRGLPVSRGRYHRILKRNSNIQVEVEVQQAEKDSEKRESEKTKKPVTSKAEKKAEKKPAKKVTTAKKATTTKKPTKPEKKEKKE